MRQSKLNKNTMYHIAAILFWIVVWQIASMVVNEEMFLASPFAVLGALLDLAGKGMFWMSIFNSVFKIIIGFCMAIIIGILFATLSYVSLIFKEIITPLIRITKAAPVASFIILALIWIKSKNLSILISFLIVIPIIYTTVLQGLYSTDNKLLEMAKVFRIPWTKKIRHIYLPAVMPYFVSACSVGLGFCWKSGIAAEIIGLPKNSIGEQLYEAKLYLMTKELFAWTIVIILISIVFENLIMKLLKRF
jgi:NitT/TauT family transport system permease protein